MTEEDQTAAPAEPTEMPPATDESLAPPAGTTPPDQPPPPDTTTEPTEEPAPPPTAGFGSAARSLAKGLEERNGPEHTVLRSPVPQMPLRPSWPPALPGRKFIFRRAGERPSRVPTARR
jgi:hypothetical protein